MNVQQKRLFGASVLALALFSAWALMIPGFQEIRALRSAITERKRILIERSALVTKVTNLKKEYEQRIADARKFSAVVPAGRGTAELISATEQMAQSSGVQVTELNITDEKGNTKEQYAIVSIALKGSGQYGALIGFLNNFEKNIRLIDVQNLELGQNELIPGLLIFSIKATAYSLK